MTKLDVLLIAAHPDDAEISAGGTILRLLQAGARVGIADMTRGEMGTRGTQADRDKETQAASEALGLTARFNLGFPDARVEASIANRESLAALIRKTQPEVLIAHYEDDPHPDHAATGRLAKQAWFLSGLKRLAELEGESPAKRPKFIFQFLSHTAPDPALVVDVTSVWQQKLAVVRCYGSQLVSEGAQDKGEHLLFGADIEQRMTTKARFFGEKIGVEYGEPLLHTGPLPVHHALQTWLPNA